MSFWIVKNLSKNKSQNVHVLLGKRRQTMVPPCTRASVVQYSIYTVRIKVSTRIWSEFINSAIHGFSDFSVEGGTTGRSMIGSLHATGTLRFLANHPIRNTSAFTDQLASMKRNPLKSAAGSAAQTDVIFWNGRHPYPPDRDKVDKAPVPKPGISVQKE